MPSKNREKVYLANSYYHLYNRGVNKRDVFLDDDDYRVFLNLLKRYLDSEPMKDNKGRLYMSLHDQIEMLAYCLMPNHYHLLIYQYDAEAMSKLMRSVCTSFTMYFNKKYQRIGPLFQDRFKAAMITNDEYLHHISRYIHLNPLRYLSWRYSSLPYYRGTQQADWVKPQKILDLFDNNEYMEFLRDYEGHKHMLDEIKQQLANM